MMDPASRLEAAFRAAALRMQGLPIVNPALEVEAVGFAPWEGSWLGVMVTPWGMNLTLVPGEPARLAAARTGRQASLSLSRRRVRICRCARRDDR